MEQNLGATTALLANTPSSLAALLHGLPDAWTQNNEGENTWTVFGVVGHLTHCERCDWMTRAKIILDFGEARVFDPLDREGHKNELTSKSLPQFLEEFAYLRAKNLEELDRLHLTEADLARRGSHPALGGVTLSELLAAWAVHDLTHLHQISRIMAHQYRSAVGPWGRYQGVLQCAGHSS